MKCIKYSVIAIACLTCVLGCLPSQERTNLPLYSVSQAQVMQQALNQFAYLPERRRTVDLVAEVIEGQAMPDLGDEHQYTQPNRILLELMEFVGFTMTGQAANQLPNAVENVQKRHQVFGYIRPEVYQVDKAKGILGYVYKTPDTRFYVIVNLSYDTHQIPFPLGFMSSTKVSVWHSDTKAFTTFVTQGPLSIQPLTMVIVQV